jgi:hypothetical protein
MQRLRSSFPLWSMFVYNPPISSKYTQELKHDILNCIEKDITHCNKLGNILLFRDFNARKVFSSFTR